MRQLCVATVAAVASLGLWASSARADKVEISGAHICCGQCVKVIGGILKNVAGVSDAACDQGTKTVTFTAKDAKAAEAGIKAVLDGGFFGTVKVDGKEQKAEAVKKGAKADTVTVKGVHNCCGMCQKALAGLFQGAKVTSEGKGPQKDLKIEGKGLDKGEVLETLRKNGFNGKID
jgi:hypothetical protein